MAAGSNPAGSNNMQNAKDWLEEEEYRQTLLEMAIFHVQSFLEGKCDDYYVEVTIGDKTLKIGHLQGVTVIE